MQIEQVEVRTFEDETHDEQVSAFSSSSTKSREKSSLNNVYFVYPASVHSLADSLSTDPTPLPLQHPLLPILPCQPESCSQKLWDDFPSYDCSVDDGAYVGGSGATVPDDGAVGEVDDYVALKRGRKRSEAVRGGRRKEGQTANFCERRSRGREGR
jgi:hypothetical protein